MVAGLVERYFLALKRELAKQTDRFWMRVENAVAAKTPEEKIRDGVETPERSDPDKVLPAAGPPVKPELTDGDKTPEAGTPSPNDKKIDTGSG
jgi:hypothetical protein